MNQERIRQLEKLSFESPEDPFFKYALALEYLEEDPERSVDYFRDLLDKNPEYLPTYYQAAILFAEMEHNELAKNTFEKGIRLAKNDVKTLAELQNAYQNFMLELD